MTDTQNIDINAVVTAILVVISAVYRFHKRYNKSDKQRQTKADKYERQASNHDLQS